eukprot:9270546-Alexandrium_andersonii.AAC.1
MSPAPRQPPKTAGKAGRRTQGATEAGGAHMPPMSPTSGAEHNGWGTKRNRTGTTHADNKGNKART